ncbi:DUF6458 family protein [Pseudarthrobacter sp. P1]|uniref:DUF6458 family protein n=1 Tax=Pseudarthrobacter sp. P1 TaxID=3418418 RepID=UPI003CEB6B6A
MSIGGGILLIVVGAILRFALNIEVSWISVPLVGNILMGAGVVVVALGLVFALRRRGSTATRRSVIGQSDGQRVIRRTTETDDPRL